MTITILCETMAATPRTQEFNQELRKFGNVVRKRPQTGGEKTTMLIGYRMKDTDDDFLK